MLKANNTNGHMGCVRFFGAGTTGTGAYPAVGFANSQTIGSRRNIFMGEAGIDPKSSIPAGARHPVAIQMPQKAGGLASRNASKIELIQTGNGVRGLPSTGTSTITLTVLDATGGLIVSASGSATISSSASGSIIAVVNGSGSASVSLSATDATLGAIAGLTAQGTISFAGSAQSYAVGYMSGTSTNETEFSEAALARAVWSAEADDYNQSGTMGAKMNAAGGGSSPEDIAQGVWEYIIESGFEAQEVIRLLSAVAVGDATGLEGTTPTFKDISGSKNRVVASYQNGRRTISEIDAT